MDEQEIHVRRCQHCQQSIADESPILAETLKDWHESCCDKNPNTKGKSK